MKEFKRTLGYSFGDGIGISDSDGYSFGDGSLSTQNDFNFSKKIEEKNKTQYLARSIGGRSQRKVFRCE